MHASLGNVIDPLEVINEFGADAFRCYAASCALGEDNPFRKKDVIRGKKLLRKIWNVQQFINNVIKEGKPKKTNLQKIDKWILTKYSRLIEKTTKQMDCFDYSQTMKDVEYFLWHELADHYIEMVKSSIYNKDENIESIKYTLYTIGLGILKMLAVFFPHITEEIFYEVYKKYEKNDSIHISSWPEVVIFDEEMENAGETVKNYISNVRSWKSEQGIALNESLASNSTYGSKKIIQHLKTSEDIIKNTLKYPDEHKFIVGKPDIEEKIVEIKPVYSKIGPKFKKDGKKIVSWIQKNKDEIINQIEKKGDIKISEIPTIETDEDIGLLQNGYIKVQRDTKLKGKKESSILSFKEYYIELSAK